MGIETLPNTREQEPAPTKEEIISFLQQEKFFSGNYEVSREIHDAEGLAVLDIRIVTQGPDGETKYIEFTYYRKGAPTGPGRVAGTTWICSATYPSENYCDSGDEPSEIAEQIADYEDGNWVRN